MTNLFREDLVLKTSVVECWSILSINPLDWHLKQYVIDISVDTLSTIDQKSVDSLPSVNRLDVNTCRLRVNRLVTDCPLRCQWSVDGVSYSEVDQGSWFIEGIDRQLMANVLTTHDSVSTAVSIAILQAMTWQQILTFSVMDSVLNPVSHACNFNWLKLVTEVFLNFFAPDCGQQLIKWEVTSRRSLLTCLSQKNCVLQGN